MKEIICIQNSMRMKEITIKEICVLLMKMIIYNWEWILKVNSSSNSILRKDMMVEVIMKCSMEMEELDRIRKDNSYHYQDKEWVRESKWKLRTFDISILKLYMKINKLIIIIIL